MTIDWESIKYASLEHKGIDIDIPLGLPIVGKKVNDGYQAFLQENTKGIEQHFRTMVEIFKKHAVHFEDEAEILHPFAGIGLTARVINEIMWRENRFVPYHVFWERDEICVEYLENVVLHGPHEPEKVTDSYKHATLDRLSNFQYVMWDPTSGTIKTPGMVEFWDKADIADVKFVWLTDSACSKIWLHREHYRPEFGRRIEDAEDYMRAYQGYLNQRGFVICDVARERDVTYSAIWNKKYMPEGITPWDGNEIVRY